MGVLLHSMGITEEEGGRSFGKSLVNRLPNICLAVSRKVGCGDSPFASSNATLC